MGKSVEGIARIRRFWTMKAICKIATMLIVLAFILLGCKGGGEASAAASAVAGGTTSSSAGGVAKQYIPDPTMNNMNAIGVTIPAKWHFQGVLIQGGNCSPVPAGVYRATSPDGLSFAEQMPTLAWQWGRGPMIRNMPRNDCLPMNGPMSAQEFLKYLAATMKLHYDGDEAVPAAEEANAQQKLRDAQARYAPQYAAMNLQPPRQTRELARARVSYRNGTFEMKGRLAVMVDCTETVYAGMKSMLRGMADQPSSTVDKCLAGVTYLNAPQDRFDRFASQWDAAGMGMKSEDAWLEAWINRSNEESRQRIAGIIRQGEEQRAANAQQWAHSMAVQKQMHDQFMQTMQEGHDQFMAQQQANQDARATAASDWVDFALDRQTVMYPGTGQVSKVSSSYSYTWVDETGKTSYQTNDVNANPNGVLQGTWTQQTVTHGNGTAY